MIGSYWPAAPVRKPHQWSKPQPSGQWSNGPGGAHLATRREVPLPEPAGDVAVLLQDARQRRAAPRPRPGVAGERPRELRDPAHSHPMVVAAGEQRSAGRRADRRHVEPVVGQAHLLHAREVRRADPAAEGVRGRRSRRRRSGRAGRSARRRAPSGPGIIDQSADGLVDRAAGRTAEVAVGDRQHRAVGAELAHRLRERLLERAPSPSCRSATTDFASAPGSACSTASRCSSSNTAMMPAEPGGRFSPILSCISVLTRWWTNLPAMPPAAAPTAAAASSGGANRPTATPTPPPQPMPLRPRLSPVCCTETLPSSACVTRITPSISTCLALTSPTSASKSAVAVSMSG